MHPFHRLIVITVISFICAVLSFGCNTKNGRSEPPQNSILSPVPPRPSVQEEFLEGVLYITECEANQSVISGIKFPSTQKAYYERDGRFSRTENLSTVEGECESGMLIIKESGRITQSDKNINPHSSELVFEQASMILKNDLVVFAFNRSQTCGFSDWEIDIERDISLTGQIGCIDRPLFRSEKQAVYLKTSEK